MKIKCFVWLLILSGYLSAQNSATVVTDVNSQLLELPQFSLLYDFSGQSRQAQVTGVGMLQASDMTS